MLSVKIYSVPCRQGGDTPLCKLCRYVPPHRVRCLFWSENWYTLCPFWSRNGYSFWGNYGSVWTYLSFKFQIRNTERKRNTIRIRNEFEKFFCLRSNLSNENLIYALRPGLKTGMDYYIFWSETESGFGESPRIPRSNLLPGIRSSSLNVRCNIIVCVFVTQVKYKAGTIRESKIFIMKRKLPIGMALLS